MFGDMAHCDLRHGLKKRHLMRHGRDVKKFFRLLASHNFQSEAAENLRKRLITYQDKLFTFIHHDGVAWNNNNAENAIKRFAYYRAKTTGNMRETGLSDYLVLLSIYQTCRYKDISFLEFLLCDHERALGGCTGRAMAGGGLGCVGMYVIRQDGSDVI
jgi:hypothetical protein